MDLRMLWTCAAVLGLTGAAAGFQPPDDRAPRPPERAGDRRAGDQPPMDADGMRLFIARRLEDMRRRTEMFERALQRLDEGADPAAVREELEPRAGRRGLGGPGERERPEDRFGDEFPMPRRDLPPLSAAQREEAVTFLEQVAPRMGARIRQFVTSNPDKAGFMLGRLRGTLDELRGLREHDPELFELKVAEFQGAYGVMEAGRKVKEMLRAGGPPEEVRRARQELKDAIGTHFDHQLAVQQQEVKRLTDRLERLQAQIKERQENRERFIERQVENVMSRPEPGGPGGHQDRPRTRNRPD